LWNSADDKSMVHTPSPCRSCWLGHEQCGRVVAHLGCFALVVQV
jgi:hypothetical protein